MSLKIIKAGLLDTVQDLGRYGFQHLGINTGGAMDRFSAQLANAVLGKPLNSPVLELHFPAAEIRFDSDTVICICGANFRAELNGLLLPMNQPVVVRQGTTLKFQYPEFGARCYLATYHELNVEFWLNSASTNLKVNKGGRLLKTNDIVGYHSRSINLSRIHSQFLHWQAKESVDYRSQIQFLLGSEWLEIDETSRELFQRESFRIKQASDRMGFRLDGSVLNRITGKDIISSGVSFGTVQLLPDGQMIILMADHQTTGGYPRIAHIISAHLPILAQKRPGEIISFELTTLAVAQDKLHRQNNYLKEIQSMSYAKMKEVG